MSLSCEFQESLWLILILVRSWFVFRVENFKGGSWLGLFSLIKRLEKALLANFTFSLHWQESLLHRFRDKNVFRNYPKNVMINVLANICQMKVQVKRFDWNWTLKFEAEGDLFDLSIFRNQKWYCFRKNQHSLNSQHWNRHQRPSQPKNLLAVQEFTWSAPDCQVNILSEGNSTGSAIVTLACKFNGASPRFTIRTSPAHKKSSWVEHGGCKNDDAIW